MKRLICALLILTGIAGCGDHGSLDSGKSGKWNTSHWDEAAWAE